ncbi:hypothetical protein BDZ89DRAFT_1058163 [Hymenopellis radicata]|nr:hypothetical protein BDZ89DRAFT_1058163 [Hymenopellis radicata]
MAVSWHPQLLVTAATFATLRLSLLSCMAMHFATFSCVPVYLCGRDWTHNTMQLLCFRDTVLPPVRIPCILWPEHTLLCNCYVFAIWYTYLHPVYSVAGTHATLAAM